VSARPPGQEPVADENQAERQQYEREEEHASPGGPLGLPPRRLERGAELGGALIPVARRLAERAPDHRGHRRRHWSTAAVHHRHGLRQVLRGYRLRVRPVEGWLAGQHLIEHAAERVQIAPGVERGLPAHLLGTHVPRGAQHDARRRDPRVGIERPRDPEVRHQDAAVLGDENVLGLDVAVHDAVLVRVLQPPGGFAPEAEGLGKRRGRRAVEPLTQVLALDVRHGEPEMACGLAGVEDGEDVRMLQPGGGVDLVEEPLGTHLDADLGAEHLERHRPPVADVLGQVDHGHPAAPELPLDGVAIAKRVAQGGAGRGHVTFAPFRRPRSTTGG